VTADTHTQVRSRLEGSRAAEPAVSVCLKIWHLPGLGRPVRAGPVVRRVPRDSRATVTAPGERCGWPLWRVCA